MACQLAYILRIASISPASHPDMLWPANRGHTRFAHDIIQGHTQIYFGLSVCTWFTSGSHSDMLWSVGLHMIYSGVTPSDAVVCTWYNPGSHTDMLWPAIRGHTRFAHDMIQGHTQICCGLSVCTWFTLGSHPEVLYGLHMIYSRVTPRYAVACQFAHDLLRGHTQICCGLSVLNRAF